MSVSYSAVTWTPSKRRYDAVLAVGVALFIANYFVSSKLLFAGDEAISDEVLPIRSLGPCVIPPLPLALAMNCEGDTPHYFLLRARGGAPMPAELEHLIADPVELTGTHLKLGDLDILEVTPQSAPPL